ncbi:ribonuclease H-like domain-containing protein [Tanacetum coccineum]
MQARVRKGMSSTDRARVQSLLALKHVNFDLSTVGDHQKVQLNELNELRDQAYENSLIYKEKTKKIHDSKIKNRVFNVGDQVLLFNSRLKIFSGKLKTHWSGPFTVTQVFPYGTVELSQTNGPNFKEFRIDQGVGSTSGIRACALRNFNLEVMELENSQNNALAKLPMLKLGEYEMWEIRIKQYFQIQDYALWEVIENGNSWVPIPVTAPESGPSTALKMTVPSTAEEKICKKNDVKARSLLLMALPNEHQLTFNQYVDAQSMFVAIKARFGGNDATKKTQKALLKQQYENFNASSSESLDSIFNRLQKLVSRLAILGVVTPPEDLNVKFLRSLPSEWDTHVVVWMNKPDFDTMGLDDLYNNFKIVEQKVKRTAAANNDDKNLAFLTTSSPSSTNTINTVNTGVSTGTTKVNTASTETSTASFSDATVYAFLSTQPQGSQLVHEDLEQLHDDDLEEMDLKWNMALLSMRARKFYQRTGRKIIIDGSNTAGYDKSKEHQGVKTTKLESRVAHIKGRVDDEEDAFCKKGNVCYRWEEETKKARKNNDAPIIEDWVSDDEDEVEPIPKVEKKTIIPIAFKKEFVKPETPVRRSVRSKDETSEILKNFIKEVENLVDKKVKIIRSEIGTEFKNKVMDEFCREKDIKREYSVARTPQQNGVAERKNRTLIELL